MKPAAARLRLRLRKRDSHLWPAVFSAIVANAALLAAYEIGWCMGYRGREVGIEQPPTYRLFEKVAEALR